MGDLFWCQTHTCGQNVVYLAISKQQGRDSLTIPEGTDV